MFHKHRRQLFKLFFTVLLLLFFTHNYGHEVIKVFALMSPFILRHSVVSVDYRQNDGAVDDA